MREAWGSSSYIFTCGALYVKINQMSLQSPIHNGINSVEVMATYGLQISIDSKKSQKITEICEIFRKSKKKKVFDILKFKIEGSIFQVLVSYRWS